MTTLHLQEAAPPFKKPPDPNLEEILAEMADDERLLRLSDVIKQVSLGTTTIYKLMNEGSFPRAIQIGQNSVRWRQSDIKRWIAERILKSAERETA